MLQIVKHKCAFPSRAPPYSQNYQPETCGNDRFVGMNTSVTAEDLLVHYGGDGQAVEAVGERLPQLDVESAFTCKINMQ